MLPNRRSSLSRWVLFVGLFVAKPSNAEEVADSSKTFPDYPWAVPGEAWSMPFTQKEAAAMKAAAKTGPGFNLVFYGDSILQCLRFEADVCKGATKVMSKRFGKYRPFDLAIGNEQTTSLMYRLLDGAAPVDINHDNVTAVVIMLGNNDIGRRAPLQDRNATAKFGESVAEDLREISLYLIEQDPLIHVVLLSLLPATGLDFKWVGGQLYPGTVAVNQGMEEFADSQSQVYFVNCTGKFLLSTDSTMSNETLIPDGIHPTQEGFELLADCLEPRLDDILKPILNKTKKQSGKSSDEKEEDEDTSFAKENPKGSTAATTQHPPPSSQSWTPPTVSSSQDSTADVDKGSSNVVKLTPTNTVTKPSATSNSSSDNAKSTSREPSGSRDDTSVYVTPTGRHIEVPLPGNGTSKAAYSVAG